MAGCIAVEDNDNDNIFGAKANLESLTVYSDSRHCPFSQRAMQWVDSLGTDWSNSLLDSFGQFIGQFIGATDIAHSPSKQWVDLCSGCSNSLFRRQQTLPNGLTGVLVGAKGHKEKLRRSLAVGAPKGAAPVQSISNQSSNKRVSGLSSCFLKGTTAVQMFNKEQTSEPRMKLEIFWKPVHLGCS